MIIDGDADMEILADIKHVLHTIILFQCFLLAFYLLRQNVSRKKSNLILSAFLIAKGLSQFDGIFKFFRALTTLIYTHCPVLFYIPTSFFFLYMPFLFLYIQSMTRKDFQLKKLHLLHGLPFFGILLYIASNYFFRSPAVLRALLDDHYAYSTIANHAFRIIADIQFFIYAALSLKLLTVYRRRIKNIYSTIHRIDLSWLRFVLYGFIVWRSLGILETILYLILRIDCLIIMYLVSLVVFLVFVSIMVFRGLKQPKIFLGHENHKNEKLVLPKDLVKKYLRMLNTCMESEKPYINSELTLDVLSAMTSIPPRHLSKVLNEELNQNFFDFINRFRVDEAKQLLKAPRYQNYTILALAFEAGFNSKSTFNLIFKKYTHQTPSQYRKSALVV